MDHLQAGAGQCRQFHHIAVGQGGEDAEGRAVLICSRVKEAGGEDRRRAAAQAGEIGCK